MYNSEFVNDKETVKESVSSKRVTDRRRLFRRLVALAGLGFTGFLLGSQEKIGLLPPVEADEVVGSSSSGVGVYGSSNSGTGVQGVSGTGVGGYFGSGGVAAIVTLGKVGINTQPKYWLQVEFNGAYCNGATWNPASSIRWKENVTPLTEGVETLKQLHPVSFNYKKTPTRRTMGFIAEEVGKVLPTVVDWDEKEAGYAEGYDQTAILALTVQAIKELNDKNNRLLERIEVLEHKLAAN